jgi:protein-disulfide isomerase
VNELTSADIPPIAEGDHLSGEGPEAILYLDLACPACARTWAAARELPLQICFRHFPMASKRPRAPVLHAAAEAAGLQGSFWEMCDSLFGDRGRVDDPHLWERVERLELDLDRFNEDRSSTAVQERVRRDFEAGIRGGVAGTPTGWLDGRLVSRDLEGELAKLAG